MFTCINIQCHVWVFGANTQRADVRQCPACDELGKLLPGAVGLAIKDLCGQS